MNFVNALLGVLGNCINIVNIDLKTSGFVCMVYVSLSLKFAQCSLENYGRVPEALIISKTTF